ncbi:alpha-mannosidase [Paenibacillus sp. strain BS8-2]
MLNISVPTKEQQGKLTEEMMEQYRQGSLALVNGHQWLDGHITPHFHFTEAEKQVIVLLNRRRHRILFEVDRMAYAPEWKHGMEAADHPDWCGEDIGVGEAGRGGRFTVEGYSFELPPLQHFDGEAGELFFVLQPLDFSKDGWPETTIYVNGQAQAALGRWHHYWAAEQLLDQDAPNRVVLKSFGIYEQPKRGYSRVAIAARDPFVHDLYWNFRTLVEAKSILPEQSETYKQLSEALHTCVGLFMDNDNAERLHRSRMEQAAKVLDEVRTTIAEAGSTPSFILDTIFHGHHDTAWQWTVAHSRGKTERIALNNLYLMDRYPEFQYLYTAPYHYETLMQDHPDLYARLKVKAREGRWQANGAMWVEPDLHFPSGESLIRQLLLGMKFFEEEFGVKEHVLFLPDSFGFTPALPQLIRGFDLIPVLYAMRTTDKTNPHQLFRWKGIDGSEVLVNSITTPAWEYPYIPEFHPARGDRDPLSYCAPDAGPRRIYGVAETFLHKKQTNRQIFPVGWGDGGGGGVEDFLEQIRALGQIPGLPRIELTDLPTSARKQLESFDSFPVYEDEIYVDFSTTFRHAHRNKMENKAAERLLHQIEFMGAWLERQGQVYNRQRVEGLWKQVLLNQFHDIITGQEQSVKEVHVEAAERYAEVRSELEQLQQHALDQLAELIGAPQHAVIIVNSSSAAVAGVQEISLPSGVSGWRDSDGKSLSIQQSTVHADSILVELPSIPAYGYTVLQPTSSENSETSETSGTSGAESVRVDERLLIGERMMENRYIRLTVDDQARIVSLYDKRVCRELVPQGRRMNTLMLEHGPSKLYDEAAVSIEIVETGPLRAGWKITLLYGASRIVQYMLLCQDSAQLRFDCDIEWREATSLWADFPIQLTSRYCSQGIQFGYHTQTRSTNNELDADRSHLWAHGYVDVSEDDYGIALLNDIRYDHMMKEDSIRINLMADATVHNAVYQEGAGRFTYALLPHQGRMTEGGVIQESILLQNRPLVVQSRQSAPSSAVLPPQWMSVGSDNILIDTIKPAEDGSGCVIRLYEAYGRTTNTQLQLFDSVNRVYRTNMREEQAVELIADQNQLALTFRPFEVMTLKVLYA